MIKVDVLLSTFNGEKYLAQQLDSILAQEGLETKIIVRDDGSHDSTKEIIHKYAKLWPNRIEVLSSEHGNIGIIRSYELLLQNAHADYIACADQDDIWLPQKLNKSYKVLEQISPDGSVPSLVYSNLKLVDAQLVPINESFFAMTGIEPLRGESLKALVIQNAVVGCTTFFNKALKEIALPFPATCIMHDWWLALCANYFGISRYHPDAEILYRQHQNNAVGARTLLQGLRAYKKRKITSYHAILQALSLLERQPSKNTGMTKFLQELASCPKNRIKSLLKKYGIKKSGFLRNFFFYYVEKI